MTGTVATCTCTEMCLLCGSRSRRRKIHLVEKVHVPKWNGHCKQIIGSARHGYYIDLHVVAGVECIERSCAVLPGLGRIRTMDGPASAESNESNRPLPCFSSQAVSRRSDTRATFYVEGNERRCSSVYIAISAPRAWRILARCRSIAVSIMRLLLAQAGH